MSDKEKFYIELYQMINSGLASNHVYEYYRGFFMASIMIKRPNAICTFNNP